MSKLPSELSRMIDDLCRKGDQFAQIDQLDDAIEKFEAAWGLLPEPKNQWPAATWILMAAGDVYFEKHDYVSACDTLREALHSPDGEQNPFLWLRLGQSLFEVGNLNDSANALESAWRIGGAELFADEDPKFLHFVQTQLGVMSVRSKPASSRFQKPLH